MVSQLNTPSHWGFKQRWILIPRIKKHERFALTWYGGPQPGFSSVLNTKWWKDSCTAMAVLHGCLHLANRAMQERGLWHFNSFTELPVLLLRDKQEVSSLKRIILQYSWLSTGCPFSTELKSNFYFDPYYHIKTLLLGTISTGTRKKIRKGLCKVQFLKAGIKKHDTVAGNIQRPNFFAKACE